MNKKRNITDKLLTAWMTLLDGTISVPVYRSDAPPGTTTNYVLIRAESETDLSNNARHVHQPVIITEVVTRHVARINDSLAPAIDDEIAQLLFTTTNTHNLPAQDDIQITSVRRENQTTINEDDGVSRYQTIATRNIHRVAQLSLST